MNSSERFFPEQIPDNVIHSPRKKYGMISTDVEKNKSILSAAKFKPCPETVKPVVDFQVDSNRHIENVTHQENQEFPLLEEPICISDEASCQDPDYVCDPNELSEFERCSIYIEDLLHEFSVYLTGPDRGRKRQSIKGVVDDVRRILITVGATNELAIVFDNKTSTLRDKYLMKYCVACETKPSSIRKYLYSFIDSCTFLLTERVIIKDVDFDDILTTKLRLQMWRKNYATKDKLQRHVRNAEDMEMLVTPEQVQTYEKSSHAVLAKKLFAELEESTRSLSQQQYCCLRDHLYTVIHFGNAHRSGVSANMVMKECLKAKKLAGSELIELNVWNHKTADAYGPAIIMLKPNEYVWLKTFINCARSQLESKSENVFLSWCGKPMKSGDISKRLHHLWCKAGIFDDLEIPKRLSCTIIRKSTSTALRECQTGHYQDAADLMAHSLKTAEGHYYLREKRKSAAKAGGLIREHFYESSTIVMPPKIRKIWTEDELTHVTEAFGNDLQSVRRSDIKEQLPHLIDIDASPQQQFEALFDIVRRLKSR